MLVTIAQFTKFAPHAENPDSMVQAINAVQNRFGILSSRRVRYFLAQTYFETLGFTKFKEDLHYSTSERLVEVWPHRFTLDIADTAKAYAPNYVNNPEKLANLVYSNREGNGNYASGDGCKFIGRGAIETTFRNGYSLASRFLYDDDRYLNNPELLEAPMDAFLTAGYFWEVNKLNALCDSDSFTLVTEKINGSADTVPLRLKVLDIANDIFA
jgi:putative chitinase